MASEARMKPTIMVWSPAHRTSNVSYYQSYDSISMTAQHKRQLRHVMTISCNIIPLEAKEPVRLRICDSGTLNPGDQFSVPSEQEETCCSNKGLQAKVRVSGRHPSALSW